MTRWDAFKRWLFPVYAKCRYCGIVRNKSQMVKLQNDGYFCNQEEASQHWLDSQP